MADIKFGKNRTAKAVKRTQQAGYTVVMNDGTILSEPPVVKRKFPKKIAGIVGVATAGLAGGILAGKHLFGGAYVDPGTVDIVADAINDVADVAEAAEVVDAVNDLVDAAL